LKRNIGILTLNSHNNYGNKLQNFALKKILEKNDYNVETIWILSFLPTLKSVIKKIIFFERENEYIRFKRFVNFSKSLSVKYIFSKNKINKKYDYLVVGSDQVWNYSFGSLDKNMFVPFSNFHKNISYSASFGVNSIPEKLKKEYVKGLDNFKYISVREDRGKEIVEELTGRTDVEVLVDPTMLLSAEEWDKVSLKPKMLKTEKYILNYFLGEIATERKKEIERIAKENDCEIINILDKKSPFYVCGPSEFLYLEKNAFLICTDSFHSCVFAILYNRPFIIFDREQKNVKSMNTRIDTLINKFNLKNRRYEGKITKKNLEHDYSEAYSILEKEREKSNDFLKKALLNK
jgi:hypothetical protein